MTTLYQRQTAELRHVLQNMKEFHRQVAQVAQQLQEAFLQNKTVYVAGNGGSATLAQHFSDEMMGRYRQDRRPYPVIALTADSAVLTCIGNDYGYEHIFARQLEALGQEGDIFMAYSTSGNSANILAAVLQAKKQGMTVVAFTGPAGKLKEVADYAVVSPAQTTNRIQELDLHAIHLLCEAFEPSVEKI
ncbi:MAG: SIS domain-containing protein [Candidatus Andersenbacteria bacterium]